MGFKMGLNVSIGSILSGSFSRLCFNRSKWIYQKALFLLLGFSFLFFSHFSPRHCSRSQDGNISERLSDELQPLLEAEKEKAKDSRRHEDTMQFDGL